jgi:hypothetical protein
MRGQDIRYDYTAINKCEDIFYEHKHVKEWKYAPAQKCLWLHLQLYEMYMCCKFVGLCTEAHLRKMPTPHVTVLRTQCSVSSLWLLRDYSVMWRKWFRHNNHSTIIALREVARSGWTGGARGDAHAHYTIAKYSSFTYTVPLQVTHVLCICACN